MHFANRLGLLDADPEHSRTWARFPCQDSRRGPELERLHRADEGSEREYARIEPARWTALATAARAPDLLEIHPGAHCLLVQPNVEQPPMNAQQSR
jgi:hypothetical protein